MRHTLRHTVVVLMLVSTLALSACTPTASSPTALPPAPTPAPAFTKEPQPKFTVAPDDTTAPNDTAQPTDTAEPAVTPDDSGTDAPLPIVPPDERGPQPEQVDAFFNGFIAPDEPGGAVLVVQDGKIVYQQAYGVSEAGVPLTINSIFHLGSTGKQFTALAIMMLAEEGKLNYDDPVAQYLPELENFGDEVTIRQLLHHTSGLPDYTGDDDLLDQLFELAPEPTNADALELLSGLDGLDTEPGAEFYYNNTGYDTLGALVERVSGEPFPEFMQRRVFGPLGMRDTFSLPNPERRTDPRIVHSYTDEDGEPVLYDSDPLDNLVGSGSIYSTLYDMARYDQALYTEQLVSQATLAEAFTAGETNDGTSTEYGFGWDVGERNGHPFVAHEGAWLGFISHFARFPEDKLMVIVLFNRDFNLPEDEPAGFTVADFYLKP